MSSVLSRRNYWVYSIGLAVVWAVLLVVAGAVGSTEKWHDVFIVFCGFVLGWISTTIARYVYPPPAKWLNPKVQP